MSKLLKTVALRKGMMKEFEVLSKWNNQQHDCPLTIFNHSWLKKNSKSLKLIKVIERVNCELGFKYSKLLFETLSMYGNLHNKEMISNPNLNLRES